MIKKTVVCDRCEKGKPWVIIPKSEKLKSNTVFCKECALHYYNELIQCVEIDCPLKCSNCGVSIVGSPCCKVGDDLLCSPLCAIQYRERHFGDHDVPRYFTEEDEKMLLGEDEYVVQVYDRVFNEYRHSYWNDVEVFSSPFAAIDNMMELRKENPDRRLRVVVRHDTPMIIPETDVELIHDGD